jgi:Phospholipase_D-nuclease N-terminal
MRFEYGGIVGLLILAADIWAILNVFQSGASNGAKVVWTLVILVLPVLGLALWFFLGPRGKGA